MERTENAVELWAEEFSKKPIRLLTEKEMSGFIVWSIVKSNKSFDDNELKKILEDKKGKVADKFETFINPGRKIPQRAVQKINAETNADRIIKITLEMVIKLAAKARRQGGHFKYEDAVGKRLCVR